MQHARVRVAPIGFGTYAVVSNHARQVPTICHAISQACNDLGHALVNPNPQEDAASHGERNEESICLSRGFPAHHAI
jgi:hypothetical protein